MRKVQRPVKNKGASDLSEYYKRYDDIYRQSSEPVFVSIYQSKGLVQQKFTEFVKLNLVPVEGRLIDIGCGEGSNSIYFASQGYEVLGIDSSETAIDLAKKKMADTTFPIEFKVEDILKFNETDVQFDICTDIGCMHMLVLAAHRREYLRVVRNLLSKDGVLLLFETATKKDVHVHNENDYLLSNLEFRNEHMLQNGKTIAYSGCGGLAISLNQYIDELQVSGFEVVHSELLTVESKKFAAMVAKPK